MNRHFWRAGLAIALVASAQLVAACGASPSESVSQPNTGQTNEPQVDQGFQGTVTNSEGEPLEGCYINKGGGTEEGIFTAADGKYSANQQAGVWDIEVGCWLDGDQTKPAVVEKRTITVKQNEVTTVDVQFGN